MGFTTRNQASSDGTVIDGMLAISGTIVGTFSSALEIAFLVVVRSGPVTQNNAGGFTASAGIFTSGGNVGNYLVR